MFIDGTVRLGATCTEDTVPFPLTLGYRSPRLGAIRRRRYDQDVRRYLTPRCMGMHVTVIVLLPVFGWLTWWQFGRATSGNTLSWAYTFEWPLFAGYAIYVWWQLIHDEPTTFNRAGARAGSAAQGDGGTAPRAREDEPGWALDVGRRRKARLGSSVADQGPVDHSHGGDHGEEVDDELAAYNRYLAELNAGDHRKRW